MIPLMQDRYAFRRHNTFPLRFGWLTEGYQAWSEDPNGFEDEEPRPDSESRSGRCGRFLERSGVTCAG